jgi:hypothetical protein
LLARLLEPALGFFGDLQARQIHAKLLQEAALGQQKVFLVSVQQTLEQSTLS